MPTSEWAPETEDPDDVRPIHDGTAGRSDCAPGRRPSSASRSRPHPPPTRPPRGRPPPPQRSPQACRCTPTAPSAPATSSSPTAPTTSTSGTPPTAPDSARPPTPTAASTTRSRSAPPVTFNKGGSLVSSGTQVGTGTLVYSSWRTMRAQRHHRRQHLRLQRLRTGQGLRGRQGQGQPDRSRSGAARPASTPTAPPRATGSTAYGNSSLRFGLTQLSPKTGISLGDDAADGGWSHPLYTVTPGVPGDSGSAFVSRRRQGRRHPVDARPGPAAAVQQHR